MLAVTEKTKICALRICDCGLVEYRKALEQQLQLHEKRRRGEISNTILITEHPSVITLGARQSANKMLASHSELAEKQIDLVASRRGGGTTAHNPGQLVFYPILNLQQLDMGINEYIRELESIGAELLGQLGIHAQRREGLPGLWVAPRASRQGQGDKKIASIGVRVSKFVSYHPSTCHR